MVKFPPHGRNHMHRPALLLIFAASITFTMICPVTSGTLKADREIHRITDSAKGGGDEALPPDFPIGPGEVLGDWAYLNGTHIMQTKDTAMVCLDGCPMDGDQCWDSPHSPDTPFDGGHRDYYCSRACIAMIARIGGCSLSQDRISYYVMEEAGAASESARRTGHIGDPFGDLGHEMPFLETDILMALDWLYDQPAGSSRTVRFTMSVFDDGDPSDMDTIKEFIDDGRPVIRDVTATHTAIHSTVIDGYAIVTARDGEVLNYVHTLDPADPLEPVVDEEGFTDAQPGSRWEVLIPGQTLHIEFPPASGAPMRTDEPGISADTDGDGLVDFDEVERFETDPNSADTDGDGLDDKTDMLGYLFDPDGSYNLRNRDIDHDGSPKELDSDNDDPENESVNDGCEDENQNGFYDPGGAYETNCFSLSDDFSVYNPRCFLGTIRIHGTGTHSSPFATATPTEEIVIEAGFPLDSEEFLHEHTWSISGRAQMEAGMLLIESVTSGSGEGTARVTIELNEDLTYRITTDVDPREGTYTINTSGQVSIHTLYFAFADHHWDYLGENTPPWMVSQLEEWGPMNIMEGEAEVMEDGVLRLAGEDTYTMPGMANFSAGSVREWDIRIPANY